MTDKLQQVLDTPGCERLRDFAAVGPAQRAALELFVDWIAAVGWQAEPVATQYIALCDAMGYNERKDSLTSPEEHAKSLVAEIKRLSDAHRDELLAEIKRLKQRAVPMTDEELHSVLQQVAESLGDVSIVMTHWPQVARAIEARKART